MKWISNGDPPLYVWLGDNWYNQKDKKTYFSDIGRQCWHHFDSYESKEPSNVIPFPKKTKIMLKIPEISNICE